MSYFSGIHLSKTAVEDFKFVNGTARDVSKMSLFEDIA